MRGSGLRSKWLPCHSIDTLVISRTIYSTDIPLSASYEKIATYSLKFKLVLAKLLARMYL